MRNYDPSETADHLSWKQLIVIWVLAAAISLIFASGVIAAPAPFSCEQVQAFVHGKTHDQLQAVLAGMNQHERAAAAQCLQKAKPHTTTKAQPAPVVVPIAIPAPVAPPVVAPPPVVETVAVLPAPKPKPKKGSLMKLIEIILVAGGGIVAYLVMKYGVAAAVLKLVTWWNARKLVPTTQMLLDAHAAFEARLTELEDRFKPAAAPEPQSGTVVINEVAHGQEVVEPAKV